MVQKNVEIMVLLKYLSNSGRTLEMSLSNFEIIPDLNWFEKCVLVATDVTNQGTTFSITVQNFMFQLYIINSR